MNSLFYTGQPPQGLVDDSLPELLLFNGHIHTMNPDRPLASVLAAVGQDLIYVGDDLKAAEKALSGRARRIDLKGRAAIPGLIDGHAHLLAEGIKLAELDVFQKSKEETLAIISEETRRHPKGEWIVGHGWNQEVWPGQRWPDKEELDRAAPDHPVLLDRVDKHSSWVNSQALNRAGLTPDSPEPAGGEFLKNSAGQLQGILIGQAMWAVKNIIPPLDEPGSYRALMRGQAEMLSYGVTSLMEAGATRASLSLLKTAAARGELKLRVRAMLLALAREDAAYLADGGRKIRGLYGERLSIDGVKIHSDGSLGSRSAWLLQDYNDRPGHRGAPNYSDEELEKIMRRARAHDLGISIHAIGDAAVGQALDAMEKALGPEPGDHRWRIEHFQVVSEDDRERALALGVLPSIQSVGLMSDMNMAEDRLGPDRIKRAYAWREILDRGGRLVNGSDGPVESVNPFEGMYAAVTRKNLADQPNGGWYPEHRLSRLEALQTYTNWSAWSEFNEHRKGTLQPGFLADLAVLDRDLFNCPEAEIKDIKVLMTIVGGEVVFERPKEPEG